MSSADRKQGSKYFLALVPLLIFACLAVLFLTRLGSGDSSKIPSTLIGKAMPQFDLPRLELASGTLSQRMTQNDLANGSVTLVNVFASWCVPCHVEHPVLMALASDKELKDEGLRVTGLAYKDEVENTRRFLGSKGNPYSVIAVDSAGRTAIDWGVYGVPETFIVRADGTISFKFVGPISEESLKTIIRPEILKAARNRN